MQNVIAAVTRFASEDDGQDLLEYGLLAVLIAVVAMVAVTTVGQQITTVFWNGIAQNF
ncbi:MAG: Flp family type IVb pilin [Acidobacteria bacterium]|nr:MAG: Flp family type IVb pilin [Acidobacteriota bacterium]PYR05854.1 MAG: Flp family type IVb pilin [Acidobacteriota bacterium]